MIYGVKIIYDARRKGESGTENFPKKSVKKSCSGLSESYQFYVLFVEISDNIWYLPPRMKENKVI